MVGLVDRLRALLCARHARSLAAQLVALDSGYCASSAGGTAPLAFLPTSGRGPAQHGLASRTRAAPLASLPMQPAHARRIRGGLERNRAPSDAEDGEPVSAVTAASGTTPSASLVPAAPRTAWHFANSASHASWCDIWAWHMTPNVISTTRIVQRFLHRTEDASRATVIDPCMLRGTDASMEETQ